MKDFRFVTGLVAALSIVGCAKGFDRGQMDTALRLGRPTFISSKLTVEEIENLRPQIQLPTRLAVAPPTVAYSRWRGEDVSSWSAGELAEIESWEEPLQRAGIIKDLVVLPSVLVEQCGRDDSGCVIRARRAAAARVGADTLLMISLVTAVDEYVNPASVLDVTIVGAWVAPGHHRDALTIVEGAMIDNRNEYLYAFARGEGEAKLVRPLAYARAEKAIGPSRLSALKSFGREFVKHASSLRAR